MTSPGLVLPVDVLAHQTLDAIIAAAFDLGVDLPADRYVTTGPAVHDCPQVVVSSLNLRTGLPASGNIAGSNIPGAAANGMQWCAPPWSLAMVVEIVRDCQPIPNTRSGTMNKTALATAALVPATDVEVLRQSFNYLAENQWAPFDVSIQLNPITGAFVATTANLTVALS